MHFAHSSPTDEQRDRTETWPPERIDAEIREYQRAKATCVPAEER